MGGRGFLMLTAEELLLLLLREFGAQGDERSGGKQEERGETAADLPSGTHGV